jgi:NADPH:quinone reductase-like Zn-dependent oxidoreductase
MGAQVIVTSSSEEKPGRAKALGAAHGVNYKATLEWTAVVELTGGGVDHIVEVENGTLAAAARIRVGGKIT